jgi:hypothetical protein
MPVAGLDPGIVAGIYVFLATPVIPVRGEAASPESITTG